LDLGVGPHRVSFLRFVLFVEVFLREHTCVFERRTWRL
jgi:hypothetical protein